MQRFLDICLAGTALLILSPILVPVVIALRLTGEGEVFYCQQRVGRGGAMFRVYKFATMLKNSPSLGTGTVTLMNDPRVLPLGRILRKTKVNELPQLLNILGGTMSVIGPRPQTQRCFDAFPISSQEAIKRVRPGLSGIGSIIFHNEEILIASDVDPDKFYDHTIMPYKGLLEEWYGCNKSTTTYIKLIFLTVWLLFSSRHDLAWRIFSDLPYPEEDLAQKLNISIRSTS